jgi:hypothetical protein
VVVSVESPVVVASSALGVPLIVSDPMPEALELNSWGSPFTVTVTEPGVPVCTVIES